ncbi:alpha-glucosidase [Oscillospiraceae bacterium HV4-5-C5C]|nr:alpha-glucosidase [Oscillospiraceae bacterium HV4-5-C5C]
MQQPWWKQSIVYQIYPRSFMDSNGDGIGDLNGITSRLDYLQQLGIDVIWLSPVYQSPNADNGYDISDYEAIMREFGSMADFDRLLAAIHQRGMKLVMDLVVNHTSDEHAWFIESRSSRHHPRRDFYIWRDPVDGHEPNNWGSFFSGPAWKLDPGSGQYYLHLFAPKQPDLNWTNPQVRQAVFDMMTRWCDKGIDGFRMDVISLISKPEGLPDAPVLPGELYGTPGICANGPHVHDYLQEMRQAVLRHYDLMTVGECAGVTVGEARKYANADGSELNMVFQFEHMSLDCPEGFKWSLSPLPLVPLKENLSKWQLELDGKAWNSLYFCNHDQPRIINRLGDPSPQYRERSAKCIATCLHLMQGTPYIYQGEELGMTNFPWSSVEEFNDLESINAFNELTQKGGWDPAVIFPMIAHKSRDNARTPMQWDATPQAGFTTGTPWLPVNPNYPEINAAEQLQRPDSVYHYYQQLIRLRHDSELVKYGHYELLLAQDPDLFVYRRYLETKQLLCVCNVSRQTRQFDLPGAFKGGRVLIHNLPELAAERGQLEPYEAYVISRTGE